jgi:hypothetical protein
MGANSPEAFWRSGEPQKTTAIPHSLTKAGIKRQNFNSGHIFLPYSCEVNPRRLPPARSAKDSARSCALLAD